MMQQDANNQPLREATRLAPSPTGALHLGNARTFVVNWILARRRDWRVVLRIEDLDGPRVKPEAIGQTIEVLEWLGLDWDEGPILQSEDRERHMGAVAELAARGLAYPCALTRTEIEAAASAPHLGGAPASPPMRPVDLRPAAFRDAGTNWRFVMPDREVQIDDACAARSVHRPLDDAGDVVIWTKRGMAAYHLAVVADDHAQGITHVVRGDDLLPSAAVQRCLYDALGIGPLPAYAHLPLVVGPDGRRLAKRHGDSRLVRYRDAGVPPERILGLLASWSVPDPDPGPAREPLDLEAFAARFDLDTMPRDPARFTPEDDAWLLGRS
ncbi:MAG: glutamate--tRNA ligase family protein [Planctomycetota bacterium]